MKYPCIIRNDNEIEMILFNEDTAIILSGIHKGHPHDVYPRFRNRYTNITHEYLSNTWGVVESKEHAEFIIELARGAGLTISDTWNNTYDYFSLDHNGLLFWSDKAPAESRGLDKITIPLPPKAESKFSGRRSIINPHNIDIKLSAPELPEAGHNLVFAPEQDLKAARRNAKELRKEMNCSDGPLSKEWPCVGDEVKVTVDSFNRDDISSTFVNEANKSIITVEHVGVFNGDRVATVSVNEQGVLVGYQAFKANTLQKPKTPEEALRDDIKQEVFSHFAIFPELLDKRDTVISISECVSNSLLTKYNITPKEV